MHVMFIHPNFPAQFGHIAHYLSTKLGWQCTFVTSVDTRHLNLPFNHINYRLKDDEPQPKVFYNPGTLDGMFAHMQAIYRGLRNVSQIKPDLVVGHSSYGSMLYLRNIYDCPFIGYFELLPPKFWTDEMILRKEYPPPEAMRLFNASYHTFTHLHLAYMDKFYCPTHYQKSTAPAEYQDKIDVIFDGVETEVFKPQKLSRPYTFRDIQINPDTKVVTYCSRGLESIRGFDIFMKVAKRICQEMDNVIFLIAGQERTFYGHEMHHIPKEKSFKQYVLDQDDYDLSKFHFLGLIPPMDLVTMFNLSDLHIYLTAPYVLSWSMIQAMSTGCAILASDTKPVQEAIDHGQQGILVDFYDVDAMTDNAMKMLRDPAEFQSMREGARNRVLERYEKEHCIQQMIKLYRSVVGDKSSLESFFSQMGGATGMPDMPLTDQPLEGSSDGPKITFTDEGTSDPNN